MLVAILTVFRTVEQSEGDKTVGVDPTVITARKEKQATILCTTILIYNS